jgi:hypothetical protein
MLEPAVIDDFLKSLFGLTVTDNAGFLRKRQALRHYFGRLNLCTGVRKKACYYYLICALI